MGQIGYPKMTTQKGKLHNNMATEKSTTTHTAQPVELNRIHVDPTWNSRAMRNVRDMADTESAGFDGFEANIRTTGQISAVILRNTGGKTLAGGKTDKPYELVCGFRRHNAITDLNAKKATKPCVPGLPDGFIMAEVRELSPLEARILNGQENTVRKNLKAPDLVFLAADLAKTGMTQTSICESLGVTQGWVSKLLKIATLPPAVLAHWRDEQPIAPVQTKDGVFEIKADENGKAVPSREMTEPEMRALAETKGTPEETTARYIRTIRPNISKGDSDAGPSESDKILDKVVEIASLMGCMVRVGVLDNGSLDWTRVIGPKKKGYPIDSGKDDSQERMITLGDAAQEAFEKEITRGAKGRTEKVA